MFKKLYEKFNNLESIITRTYRSLVKEHDCTRDIIDRLSREHKYTLDKMSNTIESQQRTIEQLTNALKDKYEHGLFIVSEDCKIPMVIRNGEIILNGRTTSFTLTWNAGEAPIIETEMYAGTISDVED